MRWSEAGCLSRIVLIRATHGHDSRQAPVSLILDVRQKNERRREIRWRSRFFRHAAASKAGHDCIGAISEPRRSDTVLPSLSRNDPRRRNHASAWTAPMRMEDRLQLWKMRFHFPRTMKHFERKTPNQSLQTMTTAVTCRAAHAPRQLRSCLI
jgi:hypothetical protein